MLNKEAITETLKNNLRFIQNNFQVTNIGIFGSYIREEATEESDLDVLVEFEKGHKDFFNYVRLKNYLEGLFGLKVDLILKDAVKAQLKERIFQEVRYV